MKQKRSTRGLEVLAQMFREMLARRQNGRLVIKPMREILGFTQEGYARAIGVSRRTVQRWECEDAIPRIGDIKRMFALTATHERHLMEMHGVCAIPEEHTDFPELHT